MTVRQSLHMQLHYKLVLMNWRGFYLNANVWLLSSSKINDVVSLTWGNPESQQTNDWCVGFRTWIQSNKDCFYTFSCNEWVLDPFSDEYLMMLHLTVICFSYIQGTAALVRTPRCVMDFPGLYPDHWNKCLTQSATFNRYIHTHTSWAHLDAPVMNQNTK